MKRLKGVKITHIYIVLVVLFVIASVIVVYSMHESSNVVDRLQSKTEEYISVQEAISSMREASDYLTERARAYVVTGNKDDIQEFFDEVYKDRRRDKAIETITEYNESDTIQKSLEDSLKYSNELLEIEKYAMKLATVAHGVKDSNVDAYLAGVTLTAGDRALGSDEQLHKASEMVFDENYESYKTRIKQGVFDGLDRLIEDTRAEEIALYNLSNRLSVRVQFMYYLMLILALLAFLITSVGVIMPLNNSINFIKQNEQLPVNGSGEYNFLAMTFNRMLEKNQKHSEMLSYEATHDELTGLYNRKLFEDKRVEIEGQDSALILFDVDYFKGVNDTYGHEVGDKILKKVAGALAGSFRNEDYVCRIGGDEFAVIMVQMTPDIGFVISRKVEQVRSKLEVDDGLPATTLSIGAAFAADSEDGSAEELFRNADEALYKVKKAGRNGFSFYKEPADS